MVKKTLFTSENGSVLEVFDFEDPSLGHRFYSYKDGENCLTFAADGNIPIQVLKSVYENERKEQVNSGNEIGIIDDLACTSYKVEVDNQGNSVDIPGITVRYLKQILSHSAVDADDMIVHVDLRDDKTPGMSYRPILGIVGRPGLLQFVGPALTKALEEAKDAGH